jgi:putative colanic acid biosynthesis acetyltransferase WcaF
MLSKTGERGVKLRDYDHSRHSPGAGFARRVLWYVCNAVVFASWLIPVSAPKRWLLRRFGARIGSGVVIKPRVNIKYPWRLSVGEDSWIGEGVWIDNVGRVDIDRDVCLSQGAQLLTGNHDYRDPAFGLLVGPIVIEKEAWVGAFSTVCPGVRVASSSVVTAGSVLTRSTESGCVYSGNPASVRRRRYGLESVGDSSASSSAATAGEMAARYARTS